MAEETIIGGRQVAEFLQQLPVKIEKNIMRAALRAGGIVFRDEARANIRDDDGDLSASVQVTTRIRRGTVYASVKAGGRRAPHWHWVEFGTAPHKIRPKRQRALSFGGAIAGEVDHPGSQPKPYMRPALDAKSQAAIAAVADKVRGRLTKEGINVPALEAE
ncbi:HK97-gp10 family putative phage morphogenesis protein [Massilia sp. DD77]|uniref:HK97-gp10 family putative phage morphogenesis protein n=1 Tax=Massilia sp. DD77 TaxID=3109349 RepID=UPI003000D80A